MFIGGLNWETTDESLKAYFSQFGEVIECTVMRDGATGRSRGFGFLTFKDPKNVNTVMVKEHMLDGKLIDPKRAIPRDEQERTAKIFVGGVSQECDQETFKNYFKQFGNVLDATLMMDKNTNRPRGFGFVTFDNDAAVDRTLEQPLSICNKYIEIKRAQPRGDMREQDPRGLNKLNKNGGGPLFNRAGSTAGAGGQQMSPAMMAAYWQRMQQYFQMMQQQMTANSMGGMGAMHPAMMQQMMARQGMMQQMMGGQPSSSTGDGSPMHPGSPSQEGQHQGQDMGGMNMGMGGIGMGMGMGNSSSWEGMYDDVPAPGHMRGGYGAGQRGGGATGTPPSAAGTPQAPANAPTGPRNAGRPGANYRGGGRGGHRGFHPYARGA
ncbi:hypothetical protein K470DRAFT_211783 [Piedraia hortae CBS 480.64]|uniref:RRM domain-containing protein n=1 Tax=Piedraia hortae CBS 480.64 TaxID=1314780 RepID=A0A6A7C7J3_9PEZI|nr:hypothetical protein K470DRAFT_211783 [Piedraia hortae CBS 480.64]